MAKKLTLASGPVIGGVTKLATVLQPCSYIHSNERSRGQVFAQEHVGTAQINSMDNVRVNAIADRDVQLWR